jgi:amidase
MAAVDLARMIRSRELSAAELLEATLARIEAVNPAVNAIVTLAAEQARATVADLDARAAHGEFASLHGLPIAIKDWWRRSGCGPPSARRSFLPRAASTCRTWRCSSRPEP